MARFTYLLLSFELFRNFLISRFKKILFIWFFIAGYCVFLIDLFPKLTIFLYYPWWVLSSSCWNIFSNRKLTLKLPKPLFILSWNSLFYGFCPSVKSAILWEMQKKPSPSKQFVFLSIWRHLSWVQTLFPSEHSLSFSTHTYTNTHTHTCFPR